MAKSLIIAHQTVATAANAGDAAVSIWNASGKTIRVKEIWLSVMSAAAANVGINRIDTRGTAATTVTLQAGNLTNVSMGLGSLANIHLDTDFSAEPSWTNTNRLFSIRVPAVDGAGFMVQFPEPIEVPNGAGLALNTLTAIVFPQSLVTFVVEA